MNQDQIKELLLKLEECEEFFTVILSGKKSKKANGIYKPETREIILHNKNFQSDNQLIFTAIHEYAHHLHFTRSGVPISNRSHTKKFYEIFHSLLIKAETTGIYNNIFKTDERFVQLTNTIKQEFLAKNGQLMKDFGRILFEAFELCLQCHVSFEDYIDRELGFFRNQAKTIMKMHSFDLDPAIGYENMKTVAAINDDILRKQAEEAFIQGQSPYLVKKQFSRQNNDPERDAVENLIQEKNRIKKTIQRLNERLDMIEKQIDKLET